MITWLYMALNRTPNIDCYWVGAVLNLQGISPSIGSRVEATPHPDKKKDMLGFRVSSTLIIQFGVPSSKSSAITNQSMLASDGISKRAYPLLN